MVKPDGFINGKIIEYSFKDAYSAITLAYACTCHKAQGMEYDYIKKTKRNFKFFNLFIQKV